MAEIRAIGNIAGCPLKRLRIEKELTCRIRQPSILQTVRPHRIAIATGIQVVRPFRRRPGEPCTQCNDSVRLPSFEQNTGSPVKGLTEWNVPYEVDYRVVCQVKFAHGSRVGAVGGDLPA